MRSDKPLPLRMNPALKVWLTEEAKRNHRSLNQEMVYRLIVAVRNDALQLRSATLEVPGSAE